MKGKSINFFSSAETLCPPYSVSLASFAAPTPHNRPYPFFNCPLQTSKAATLKCWWLKKGIARFLFSQRKFISEKTVFRPNPIWEHQRMKIWQLNINIFMLAILLVQFLSFFARLFHQSIDSHSFILSPGFHVRDSTICFFKWVEIWRGKVLSGLVQLNWNCASMKASFEGL